jgi:hypothetical protein
VLARERPLALGAQILEPRPFGPGEVRQVALNASGNSGRGADRYGTDRQVITSAQKAPSTVPTRRRVTMTRIGGERVGNQDALDESVIACALPAVVLKRACAGRPAATWQL